MLQPHRFSAVVKLPSSMENNAVAKPNPGGFFCIGDRFKECVDPCMKEMRLEFAVESVLQSPAPVRSLHGEKPHLSVDMVK